MHVWMHVSACRTASVSPSWPVSVASPTAQRLSWFIYLFIYWSFFFIASIWQTFSPLQTAATFWPCSRWDVLLGIAGPCDSARLYFRSCRQTLPQQLVHYVPDSFLLPNFPPWVTGDCYSSQKLLQVDLGLRVEFTIIFFVCVSLPV